MENVFTLLRNKDHTAATLLGYESFFFSILYIEALQTNCNRFEQAN